MSADLDSVLQNKITALEAEKEKLKERITCINGKLELLRELQGETLSGVVEDPAVEGSPVPAPERRPAKLKKSSNSLRDNPPADPVRDAIREHTRQMDAPSQTSTNKHGAQVNISGRDGSVKVSL